MFDVFKRYSTGNFPTTGFLLMICFHHLILETSAIWSALECWVLLLNYIWICLKRSKEKGGGSACMLRQFSRHALLFYQIKIQLFSKLYTLNETSNLFLDTGYFIQKRQIWLVQYSWRVSCFTLGTTSLKSIFEFEWNAKLVEQKCTFHSLSEDRVSKN